MEGRSTGIREKAKSLIVIQNSMNAQLLSGSFFCIKHMFNSWEIGQILLSSYMTCNPVQAKVSVCLWTRYCPERAVEAEAWVRGQEARKVS